MSKTLRARYSKMKYLPHAIVATPNITLHILYYGTVNP